VHFVVPEMDAGPIIAQGRVPVFPDDTEAALAARVLAVEHRIYPLALKLVASGHVRVDGDRCVVADAIGAEDAPFLPATREAQ
jgi:phosphoribosylglycinamide formyltransferase-1